MTQVEQIAQQIKSEFRLDAKGQAFVTIRGAARLADVDHTALVRAFSGGEQKPSKTAEFLATNGFDYGEQISWSKTGIPDTALALILEYYGYETQERYRTQQAKLCCRAFRSVGIRAWVHEVIGWSEDPLVSSEQNTAELKAGLRDELDILKYCLDMTDLDNSLKAGIILNHAGERMPQLETAINQAHSLLAASNESDLLFTPTRIGEELGISSRKVNTLLTNLGYQIKNESKLSKTEPDYLATSTGMEFSGNTAATGKLKNGKGDNTTYQHLKWKPEIVAILRQHIANQN
jgi:hypothetical protein